MADPVSHDPQSLFDPLDVPNSLTTLYTSPSGGSERGTRIIGIYVVNHTANAVSFQLTHTESGGTAGSSKALAWDVSIPSDGVTYIFAEGIILDPGDFLSHLAGDATALAIHGYGWEMTD
jgi:hypothetical protein